MLSGRIPQPPPGPPSCVVVARDGVTTRPHGPAVKLVGTDSFGHWKDCLVSTEGEKEPRFDVFLSPKPVAESASEMVQFVLPNDANPLGSLLGGRLMHWIDLAAALAAHRHSRSYVVTASMDHIDFLVPVHVGDLIILRASVNRVFHTSMEVGVKVWVENYIAEDSQHVSSAYLTFVAVDKEGRHLTV